MRASSLPLLTRCVGSETLPRDDTKSENAQVGAEWGTMVHHWKETGIIRHANKRSATAFAKAVRVSGADRHALWPPGGTHETSLALWVGGGAPIPRKLALVGAAAETVGGQPGWLTGHSDFHWQLVDGELWVDDLKTGKCYPNPAPGEWGHDPSLDVGANRYPQDPGSEQLEFYALAIAESLEYVGVVHTSVTHWPRLPVTARESLPTRAFDSFTHDQLMAYWALLVDLEATRVRNDAISLQPPDQSAILTLNPGSHCRFCPSRKFCFVAEEFNDQ